MQQDVKDFKVENGVVKYKLQNNIPRFHELIIEIEVLKREIEALKKELKELKGGVKC